MSFSNAGNVSVWERMGLYGRSGGHVRMSRPAVEAADAWIARHGARKAEPVAVATPEPAPVAAPKAPSAAKASEPKLDAEIEAARARYGRIHPDAFHAKRSALRKGWVLVRGVPTWAPTLEDVA
jgi:hypothetical protein